MAQLAATTRLVIKTPLIKILGVVIKIRSIGAIFCHVRKKNDVILEILAIRAAPQKCKGAKLVFSNSPVIAHFLKEAVRSDITPPDRITSDPTLCTTK